jgi:hypothetical protein
MLRNTLLTFMILLMAVSLVPAENYAVLITGCTPIFQPPGADDNWNGGVPRPAGYDEFWNDTFLWFPNSGWGTGPGQKLCFVFYEKPVDGQTNRNGVSRTIGFPNSVWEPGGTRG